MSTPEGFRLIQREPKKSRSKATTQVNHDEYVVVGGYKFKKDLTQTEELIFRQEFQRPEISHDADVILIQDVKNLVLFLSPTEIVNKDLVHLLNTTTVHSFLKALIVYFECFLKTVEFLLIHRDDITGEKAQMQSEESIEIKRIFSEYLSQYRLLLAREYSAMLLGNGEMQRFYHITPVVNISQSIKDQGLHESFLAFCTQVVWISLHRKDLELVDMEMNRLFRSEHFKLTRSERFVFAGVEASMLYGRNYRRCNYRTQNSPLIQELSNVLKENRPILWIGERMYRGNDLRIAQIELEFIVPESQLCLIDVSHGILGRPKKLYDTLLNISWEAVRSQNYSEIYDPYGIVRQPYLEIPKLDAQKMRKHCKTYESYYHLVRSWDGWTRWMIRHWLRRDAIVTYFKTEGMLTDIWMRCRKEVEDTSYGPSVEEIIKKFLAKKKKLRKK